MRIRLIVQHIPYELTDFLDLNVKKHWRIELQIRIDNRNSRLHGHAFFSDQQIVSQHEPTDPNREMVVHKSQTREPEADLGHLGRAHRITDQQARAARANLGHIIDLILDILAQLSARQTQRNDALRVQASLVDKHLRDVRHARAGQIDQKRLGHVRVGVRACGAQVVHARRRVRVGDSEFVDASGRPERAVRVRVAKVDRARVRGSAGRGHDQLDRLVGGPGVLQADRVHGVLVDERHDRDAQRPLERLVRVADAAHADRNEVDARRRVLVEDDGVSDGALFGAARRRRVGGEVDMGEDVVAERVVDGESDRVAHLDRRPAQDGRDGDVEFDGRGVEADVGDRVARVDRAWRAVGLRE